MRRLIAIGAAVVIAGALVYVFVGRGSSSSAAELPLKGHVATQAGAVGELTGPLGSFGLTLLAQQAKQAPGNVVVSPASLHAVLSMLLNGARGQTATEMRTALGLGDQPLARVDQAWADLITTAQSGDKPEVSIADSLWLRDGVSFDQSFLDLNRDYFAAEMAKLASDPAKAAADINAWVKKNTAGKITDIVAPSDFDDTTLLALINTIHLKVRWTHFQKADTGPMPFTKADGSKVDVQMMRSTELETAGVATPDYNLVSLSTSGPVTVWIIVPNGSQTPETVIAALQETGLRTALKAAQGLSADVFLPRLSIKYTAKGLQGGLEAAGMKRAFDPELAQFDGIANVHPLFVQTVVQKATLDMTEEGVEAAAATGLIAGTTAAPVDPFTVRADRPYLVVLTEKSSLAPLFLAVVRDPS
jgi:serine protease inhibitor